MHIVLCFFQLILTKLFKIGMKNEFCILFIWIQFERRVDNNVTLLTNNVQMYFMF